VVSDGVVNGKKTINLSVGQYNKMYAAFSNGVQNPAYAREVALGNGAGAQAVANNTPTNYSFNVTGARYADSKFAGDTAVVGAGTRTTALQDDKNVGSFSITGLAKNDITTLDGLRNLLSQSKLKLVQTNSQSALATAWSSTEKTNLKNFVANIGSNTDRNKLKVVV
jgi:hypothetical protein